MKKQIILFLMALLPVVAWAVEVEIDGIRYDVIGNTAKVIKKNPIYTGDVVIPASIIVEGVECAVTSIGRSAFSGCTGLTSISIPPSITTIQWGAFGDCTGLTSVHITDLAAWCMMDFDYAYSSSLIGSNPLKYAHHLFLNGEEIKDLVIPESVTYISVQAFEGCTGLETLIIPSTVQQIGFQAFHGCINLKAIHISDMAQWCNFSWVGYSDYGSISNPLEYAHHLFLNGEEVTELVIPEGVESINGYAFSYCTELTSVSIPEHVKNWGNDYYEYFNNYNYCPPFVGCDNIKTIYFNTIDCNDSDLGLRNLQNFSFGKSVQKIPQSLMMLMSDPESIKVEDGNTVFDSRENCNALIETATNTLIKGSSKSFIPNSVECIGDSAFAYCKGIASIKIPNSVKTIGSHAFLECEGLGRNWSDRRQV